MIEGFVDFLEFLENNARYREETRQWQIPDKNNNGIWKDILKNNLVMEFLAYKAHQ